MTYIASVSPKDTNKNYANEIFQIVSRFRNKGYYYVYSLINYIYKTFNCEHPIKLLDSPIAKAALKSGYWGDSQGLCFGLAMNGIQESLQGKGQSVFQIHKDHNTKKDDKDTKSHSSYDDFYNTVCNYQINQLDQLCYTNTFISENQEFKELISNSPGYFDCKYKFQQRCITSSSNFGNFLLHLHNMSPQAKFGVHIAYNAVVDDPESGHGVSISFDGKKWLIINHDVCCYVPSIAEHLEDVVRLLFFGTISSENQHIDAVLHLYTNNQMKYVSQDLLFSIKESENSSNSESTTDTEQFTQNDLSILCNYTVNLSNGSQKSTLHNEFREKIKLLANAPNIDHTMKYAIFHNLIYSPRTSECSFSILTNCIIQTIIEEVIQSTLSLKIRESLIQNIVIDFINYSNYEHLKCIAKFILGSELFSDESKYAIFSDCMSHMKNIYKLKPKLQEVFLQEILDSKLSEKIKFELIQGKKPYKNRSWAYWGYFIYYHVVPLHINIAIREFIANGFSFKKYIELRRVFITQILNSILSLQSKISLILLNSELFMLFIFLMLDVLLSLIFILPICILAILA